MFERLTRRTESGIAYTKIPANPSNMIDGGECYTGRIIDRIAAYEDTGLTPKQIQEQQRYIKALEKQVEVEGQQAIIEAQQQEINQLKELLADWKYNAKCDADHIAALAADKDEQAGRLMKMDYLLRRTLPILEVANDQQGLIEQINELLGGKEDV